MSSYLSFRNSFDGSRVRQSGECGKVTGERVGGEKDQNNVKAPTEIEVPSVQTPPERPGENNSEVWASYVFPPSSAVCFASDDKRNKRESGDVRAQYGNDFIELKIHEDGSGRNSRCLDRITPRLSTGRKLNNIIDTVAQSQHFFEALDKMRERAAESSKDRESVPIFNKRLFSAHGSVVITSEARRLMARNARLGPGEDYPLMDKSELHTMRCVVDGLRLIHRGQDHIKDALSHVVTLESYSPHQYIVKRPYETQLSCYYIMHGAVQVTYDMDITETRSVFQPNIIYNHGAGEFLGLLSADGLSDDLSPPATVYTTESCEFVRIDRQKFHEVVERITNVQKKEKLAFFCSSKNVLSSLPPDGLEKVIEHVHKMEYPPNRLILEQGHTSEYMYFILSGRCQITRDVYIPEIDRQVCFYLDSREHGNFFGEECILDPEGPSTCHVATSIHTRLLLLHKSALEVVNKDLLLNVLESKRHYLPSDEELRDQGYRKSVWDGYKHSEVRECLKERGCLHILSRDLPEKVRVRPPSQEYIQRENLLRFVMEGAGYERFTGRACSAHNPKSIVLHKHNRSVRARTALVTSRTGPSRDHTRLETQPSLPDGARVMTGPAKETVVDIGDRKLLENVQGDVLEGPSATNTFVRMLEKNVPKGILQKIIGSKGGDMDLNALSRATEDSPELARKLRLALEIHLQDKQSDFTKTTVLVTMKTEDIVRKAKAMADKQNFVNTESDGVETNQEWKTSLHQENKVAKMHIAGDKFRAAFLRRKMNALRRKSTAARAQRLHQTALPGQLPSAKTKTSDKHSESAVFYLDDIQRKYQGLDPSCARHKINVLAYDALFVSRLQCRSRSLHDLQDLQEENEARQVKGNFHHCLSAELNSDPEILLTRRRSFQEVSLLPSTKHQLHVESTRKDAPIILKTSSFLGTKSDSTAVSAKVFPRQQSSETSPSTENFTTPMRTHYPKLQLNR
ncbi:uncharacterized protein LOC112556157 isoform X2 [Pomacea canaliculata]|uniref:uncharacterized protein LOC112556157 isoform X2 n=1 Tax=Pomacea canaliculata TaxID=400727 RepID=UPI000D72DEA9|nr:uncharacterized protein LOC112556157 isoform X2 [Pomacea canaliculata]